MSRTGDLRYYRAQSIRIIHILTVVVAKSLFVDLGEKMERLAQWRATK